MNWSEPADRYARLRQIEWLDVDRLQAARVVVAGAGALGNELIKQLCLHGVGEVRLVDPDRIELHNLTRAVLFREQDVDREKAMVAAERAGELNPGIRIEALVGDVTRHLTFDDLAGCSAVFSCVDSIGVRIALSRMCRIAGVPFINAGIDAQRYAAELYPGRSREACFECGLPAAARVAERARLSCAGLRRRQQADPAQPTTGVTASLAAAHQMALFLDLLAGGEMATAVRVYGDSRGGFSQRIDIHPSPECPGCALLSGTIRRFRCGRQNVSLDRDGRHPVAGLMLRLSEPILVEARCSRCERSTATPGVASVHDDGIESCPLCGERSVGIRVEEELPAAEWASLFPNGLPPVHHAIARMCEEIFVLEFDPLANSPENRALNALL